MALMYEVLQEKSGRETKAVEVPEDWLAITDEANEALRKAAENLYDRAENCMKRADKYTVLTVRRMVQNDVRNFLKGYYERCGKIDGLSDTAVRECMATFVEEILCSCYHMTEEASYIRKMLQEDAKKRAET